MKKRIKNQKAYQLAKKLAKAKFKLEIHLSAYFVISFFLVAINLSTSPEYWWFKWPIVAWSIVIFWYAILVIVFKGKILSLKSDTITGRKRELNI